MAELVTGFTSRLQSGESLAIDQMLNAVFLLSGVGAPDGDQRDELARLLLRELTRA